MDAFKAEYHAKCAELSIQPLAGVLDALSRRQRQQTRAHDGRRGSSSPGLRQQLDAAADPEHERPSFESLDLSGQSVPLKACSAVAAALANDVFFSRLVLADAFLGDDGCILIANALKTNATVTHLDLRGNSIRADGAMALGQMLKVNSTLKSLNLEWNCIGIWEAGIRAIADALSINQTLEELDVRNNKIGPQAIQNVALCLKHNTKLRKLDLRWNNAGIIGGRAIADLLKWNVVLMEIDLTGNEVPEDVHRSIASALDRNRDRYKHDIHTKAHTENLTSTLQSITSSHQETLSRLTSKLASSDQKSMTLSQQLSLASSEIAQSQEAYRVLEAKLERVVGEKRALEEQVTTERSQTNARINDLQHELVVERERRMKAEDGFQKVSAEASTRTLQLEAEVKKAEMDVEVLRRDKTMLLEDLAKAKEKERAIIDLWEEKLQRHEAINHNKLLALQSAKDEEIADRTRKFEERVRGLEAEKTRAQEETEAVRNKFLSEKRHWAESLSETEARIHKDEDAKRKDLESQIQSLSRQRDTLQSEVSTHLHTYTQTIKEHESELRRLQEQRSSLHQELSDLKAKETHHASDAAQLRSRLEDARRETKALEGQLASLHADLARARDEGEREKRERREDADKMHQMMVARDAVIGRLKEEIRRRDEELDAKEEDNFIKMKELQLSINTLMTQRTRKHASRSKSPEYEVAGA
ncbi:hypothetical protein BC831DRAFT_547078 [Entophlyctis helioformis]|nr:hypothetical protein BC831DRAFT_547078 [Entophlyctis helioformis]